jgi:hypothetical protein
MLPDKENFEGSLYKVLSTRFGERLKPHYQHKSTLITLSHALEDQVLRAGLTPVIFAGFQKACYYRQEYDRYELLKSCARLLELFGQGLPGQPPFEQEWFVIINEPRFKALIASYELEREPKAGLQTADEGVNAEPGKRRRFVGLWSYDPEIVDFATNFVAGYAGETARLTVESVLGLPFQFRSQANNIGQVSDRILSQLELTNYQAMNQIRRNERLLIELAQQTDQVQSITHLSQVIEIERQTMQQELAKLSEETVRSQTLMLQSVFQRTQLEQAILTGQVLLQEAREQLTQLAMPGLTHTISERLDKLQKLLNSPPEKL